MAVVVPELRLRLLITAANTRMAPIRFHSVEVNPALC